MSIELKAELRTDTGKGASRRLRHANMVPAIVYGANKDPVNIMLAQNHVLHETANESFYSTILRLNVAGNSEDVIIRDMQHHPYKQDVLHLDFQRIDASKPMHMHIPLHYLNEDDCPGVKQDGGVVSHIVVEVEIECLPKDIPQFIEVDLIDMGLGEIKHLSDIVMPEGVVLMALKHGDESHDTAVVSVHAKKAVLEVEEVVEEAAVEGAEGEAEAEKSEDDSSEG